MQNYYSIMDVLLKTFNELNIGDELKVALNKLECSNLDELIDNYKVKDLLKGGVDYNLMKELYAFLEVYELTV